MTSRKSGKSGLPPGSLVHVGKVVTGHVTIRKTEYNAGEFTETEIKDPQELFPLNPDKITWIEVCGLHQTEIISSIGQSLEIHPLLLEDILNTEHRPKFEVYGDYAFLTLKVFSFRQPSLEIETEQVSLIIGQNYILSFQESTLPIFGPVKERLRNSRGKIRSKGADYLLYSLTDVIVDQYYAVIEKTGDDLDEIEDLLFRDPSKRALIRTQQVKKNILILRKSVMPLREILHRLGRDDVALIGEQNYVFFNDVYDHIVQIIDNMETYRETGSELKDIYLSSLSNRMNEVMKLLTIIATIFIPLTFIVGIYGMNFDFMPELRWKYGYLMIWIVIIITGVGMLVYFRRRKWM